MFLSLVGPPQEKFKPAKYYVKEWLNCHRTADDMRGKKTENSHGNRNSHVWSVGPIVNCHGDSVHK